MANRKFGHLFDEFKAGGITRRQFLERAGALGVGLPVADVRRQLGPGLRRRRPGCRRRATVRRDGGPHPRRGRRAEAAPVAGADDA